MKTNKTYSAEKRMEATAQMTTIWRTRNTAGEGNKLEHMPVSAITLNSVETTAENNIQLNYKRYKND